MRGLTVLGPGDEESAARVAAALTAVLPGARPLLVAATGPRARATAVLVAEAAGRAPEDVALHVLDVAASPAVAAGHAGRPIDPAGIVARAREAELAIVACGGGVLAPLTPRYRARDLALELGLPVVVAVPAGARAAAEALGALDAVRGAGLTAAAVVLAGWPDPPSRVLLDERALLIGLAGAPVEVLGDGSPPAWPVAAWLEAATDSARVADAPAPRAALEPYRAWEPRPLGDPRATPRPLIMAAMLEIIAAEGPMVAGRAYALYNRAAGGRKLTSVARAPLSSAVYWLARERKVTLTRTDELPGQDDDLVRLPDAPAVHVRELGPRALEEVPLGEVAELVRRLRTGGGAADPTALKRAVLSAYGLVRLTARADDYLGLALGLAEG
jgi:AAA domain-containing protein